MAACRRREHGAADDAAFRLGWYDDRCFVHVGLDLQPKISFCAAAGGHDAVKTNASRGDRFDILAHTEGNAFEHRAVQVGQLVFRRQPEELRA